MVLCRAILHHLEQVSREASRKSLRMRRLLATNSAQLFYGKRSQFVSGLEAEVANVSVGRSVRYAHPTVHSNDLISLGYPRAHQGVGLPRLQGPCLQR